MTPSREFQPSGQVQTVEPKTRDPDITMEAVTSKPRRQQRQKKPSRSKKEDCQICGKTFSREKFMLRHVREIHLKVRDFQCEFCDLDFCRSYQWDNHVATVHHKLKRFKCEETEDCTYKCSTNSGLIRHIEEKHKMKKPHKCLLCDKFFSRKNSRFDHHLLCKPTIYRKKARPF
jgi:hypothetical protein